MNEYKGFRYGVREFVSEFGGEFGNETHTSLSQFLGEIFNRGEVNSELSVIDLIELGAVYVSGTRSLNPEQKIGRGEIVRVHASPRRFAAPKDLMQRIILETSESITVIKPAHLPMISTVDNVKENLVSYLEDLRGQSFFPVNNLNSEDEGLVILAKSLKAQSAIKQAFSDGQVTRRFAAFVERKTEPGTYGGIIISKCEARLTPTDVIFELTSSWHFIDAKLNEHYRLEIEITQSRPVEIRDLLAQLGAPVIGDQARGSRFKLVNELTQKPDAAICVIEYKALQL